MWLDYLVALKIYCLSVWQHKIFSSDYMMSQPRHSYYNAIAYTLEQTDRILIQMSFAFRIGSAIIIFKEKSVVDEEDLPEMQDIDKPYILSQNQG